MFVYSEKLPLIVDSREKKFVRQWLWKKGIRYNVEALKTGDYLFYDDNRDVRILVERKTVSDLVGSFRSGRLKDQMKRMSEEAVPILLITGDPKELERYVKIDKNIVSKIMSDAVVKFGFKSVIWMIGVGQETHEKGLVFMAEMLKNMELGNLDRMDKVKKERKRKDQCGMCGRKMIRIDLNGKTAIICKKGCKVDSVS